MCRPPPDAAMVNGMTGVLNKPAVRTHLTTILWQVALLAHCNDAAAAIFLARFFPGPPYGRATANVLAGVSAGAV